MRKYFNRFVQNISRMILNLRHKKHESEALSEESIRNYLLNRDVERITAFHNALWG